VLPSLRERGEDVLVLAEHFRKHYAASMNKDIRGFSRAARQKLLSHSWPGNVRELRNVIERALILETDHEINAASLPDFHLEGQLHKAAAPKPVVSGESLDEIMANMERDVITGILEQNHFSISRTADQLKISRHALRYRMHRLNISVVLDPDEDQTDILTKDGPA
jgi:DNA-binding NtrC family response regulator